jgi:transmembrane sensor
VSEQGKKAGAGDRWTEALMWYTKARRGDDRQSACIGGRSWHDWHADTENRQVLRKLARLLANREPYRRLRRPGKGELEKDTYDPSIPIAEWLKAHPANEPKTRRVSAGTWWWCTGAAAAAAILAFFLVLPLRFAQYSGFGSGSLYQTGVGGLKEVHLRDGSSITLGAETRLYVAFSAQQRAVKLVAGQAWFHVAHNRHWPFVVTAGKATITDVGTAFCVTRDADRVVVAVTEGVVAVSAGPPRSVYPEIDHLERLLASTPPLAPIRVSRGEELSFGENGVPSPVKAADINAVTAWTHGRLIFDDQSLRHVIETVDRYSPRHIVVSPSAGNLRFTGIVFDNEIEDWLQSLEGIFPVTVDERGTDIRIRMRAPNSVRHEQSR